MMDQMKEMIMPMLQQSLDQARAMLDQYETFYDMLADQYPGNLESTDLQRLCKQARLEAEQSLRNLQTQKSNSLDMDELLGNDEDEDDELTLLLKQVEEVGNEYIEWIDETLDSFAEDEDTEEETSENSEEV